MISSSYSSSLLSLNFFIPTLFYYFLFLSMTNIYLAVMIIIRVHKGHLRADFMFSLFFSILFEKDFSIEEKMFVPSLLNYLKMYYKRSRIKTLNIKIKNEKFSIVQPSKINIKDS